MAARKKKNSTKKISTLDLSTDGMREVLGYLNFSSGNSDPSFLRSLNSIWSQLSDSKNYLEQLKEVLLKNLEAIPEVESAFAETTQAESAIRIAIDGVFPAYLEYHRDLLFHVQAEDLENPFFIGKLFETVLSQGGPWNEPERIIEFSLATLNDFVGYRPIAVLENDRKMEIYAHERHRPLPLYVPDAGVAHGPYEELITHSIEFLRNAPQELLEDAYFSLEQLEELSCDLRAYDHLNPAFKRTNYMFGEWDPHRIDSKGNYRRFVIRQIVLDSLLEWVNGKHSKTARKERLFDAAAALCGTMIMASSISGAGPGTHDSTISLTTLLPIVARRRDEFYARIMSDTTGTRAKRLHDEAQKTQQPFGHIRQFLNMQLAGYGARQVQHRELAHLYAAMGYSEASRTQANAIPACSIRIESEIECSVATIHQSLDENDVETAVAILRELPKLVTRGIECGALVDPWNILGFQGQYPLFSAREDAIPDTRVETLLGLMESSLNAFSRTLSETGAKGLVSAREEVSVIYQGFADWWDRFGSDVIEDLPDVDGHESWESATHVSEIMSKWRSAGEAAGDISFWRERVEKFQSAQSYALVVDALLHKGDEIASMGLLMQWLSQLDDVGFECPQHSIFSLLIRWMKLATSEQGEDGNTFEQQANAIRRMFAFLEANAEDWWGVPVLGSDLDENDGLSPTDLLFGGGDFEEGEFEEEESEDDLFGAAYDDMVFRDSAEDGNWGDTVEGNTGLNNGEFESLNRELEPRLKFLNAVGQLWQMAAASIAGEMFKNQGE